MKPEHDTGASQAMSGRRAFLGLAAGVGGVLLAPGVHLMEIAQAAVPAATAGANPKVRWGLLIDTTKCETGCTDCVGACNTENGLSGGTAPTDAQWIRKIEFLAEDKKGFWEVRGYSNSAEPWFNDRYSTD